MSRKPVDKRSLDQRVLDFIQARRLISGGEIVLVAVSGGQDSVCLLHVLNNLQSVLDIKLHVAHLNHQLRGKEAAADARYVAALAKKLGIPCTVEKRDVLSYQKEHGLSLEEAAREVRYGFLASVAEAVGADLVAVGHTLDDQAETILLHLVRGTGTKGLRGLRPAAGWPYAGGKLQIIRPLLEVRREETGAYCTDFNLQPRQDATNLSLEPLRNKVRLELLPLLKSYNPQMVEALQRAARLAGDDIEYLESEAVKIWPQLVRMLGNAVILEKKALGNLPVSMQRYILRRAIEQTAGNLKDIEARHIEELIHGLNKPAGKKISLPYGLVFAIDYENYRLEKVHSEASPLAELTGEYAVKIPGETTVPCWKIKAALVKTMVAKKTDGFTAYVDYSKTGNKLIVRSRKTGDRFQPLGMQQTKKIGEYMLDAKIPQELRENIPIVVSAAGIVWVAGYRIDERVKVTETTKKILCLKLARI
jgi:tRNA(Ile)-lysidine synthase